MKKVIITFLFVVGTTVYAQNSDPKADFLAEITAYQKKMNAEFASEKSSPLLPKDRRNFKSLDFYPANENYKIKAVFIPTADATPFEMPTTTDRKPIYKEFGTATFELDGKMHTLHIYQNVELMRQIYYKNYLFVPFFDTTNGKETYSGGRFMEVNQPVGGTIILDFNKAYNPYCAYNYKYSCPIPPAENKLNVAIKAGVKAFKK